MTNPRIRNLSSLFLTLAALSLILLLLLRPQTGLAAAKGALRLWAQVVVPALLPFFLLSELLLTLGAARRAGQALAPLMRPLFNLPGPASLAVVMGFCSGFPTGAAVTAGLVREGLVTREEASRLLAFTNNAGPLYLTAALCVGLLDCPAAAPLLAAVHYGLSLALGLLLGRLSRRRPCRQPPAQPTSTGMPPPNPSPSAGHAERPSTGPQPLSQPTSTGMPPPDPSPSAGHAERPSTGPQSLSQPTSTGMPPPDPSPSAGPTTLKRAAERAAANLLLIGCFMVLFSLPAALLLPGSADGGYPGGPLLPALSRGLWEMSLGAEAWAQSGLKLDLLLPLLAAQLAWGGISVQAQVLAMVAGCGVSPRIYLLTRPLLALAAALACRLALSAWGLPVLAGSLNPPLAAGTAWPLSLGLSLAAGLVWLLCCLLGRLISFLLPGNNT